MTERVQKIIASRGLMSRRAAEKLIEQGGVIIDGQIAVLGQSADPETQTISVNGTPLPPLPRKCYLLLCKPRGVVTTCHDPQGRKTVMDCLSARYETLVPVGRLDTQTEGLLLLSNDGGFIKTMTHPSHEIEKEYHVTVSGDISRALPILREPMMIDGVMTRGAKARQLCGNRIAITIHEGKNRQVRRMCAAADLTVLQLIRVRVGSLRLGEMMPGDLRELTTYEIKSLTEQAKMQKGR